MKHITFKIFLLVFFNSLSFDGKAIILASEIDSAFYKAFRKDIGGWVAADATFSIALPDGRVLWLFGDTFFGGTNPDGSIKSNAKFLRNSCVLQDGDSLSTLFSGTLQDPQTFILTDRPDSTWYWPEHGIVENDSLYIFLAKFKLASGPAGFNFASDGNDIACFTYPEMKFVRIIPLPFYQINKVFYGDRLLQDSAYTYIYGRKEENGITYPHMARARKDELPGAWEFWDGWQWITDPTTSRKINTFQVSQQYAVFPHENKYVLITQDIWFSSDIWSFTSNTLTGPWKNKTKIYTTPKLAPSSITYNAYAHPQFDKDGELLVSFNNNADFGEVLKNAELYRPTFVRIPYSIIDPDFTTSSEGLNVKKNENAYLNIFPNPGNLNACIEFSVPKDGMVNLTLMDISGRELKCVFSEDVSKGLHFMDMDISDLHEGVYFFRLKNATTLLTQTFIKSS